MHSLHGQHIICTCLGEGGSELSDHIEGLIGQFSLQKRHEVSQLLWSTRRKVFETHNKLEKWPHYIILHVSNIEQPTLGQMMSP